MKEGIMPIYTSYLHHANKNSLQSLMHTRRQTSSDPYFYSIPYLETRRNLLIACNSLLINALNTHVCMYIMFH